MENIGNEFNSYDERMAWLAATLFTDVHHGAALTEEELEYRKQMQVLYAKEIEAAKAILAADANFAGLAYEDKIKTAIALLDSLIKKTGKEEEMINVSSDKVNYASVTDLLETIPQEPYQPIINEEENKSNSL